MTRLPDLHRQLLDAARRQETQDAAAQGVTARQTRVRFRLLQRVAHMTGGRRGRLPVGDGRTPVVSGAGRRGRFGALRPLIAVPVLLLASAAIALAAGGVILTGSPVPGDSHLRPGRGIGVPSKMGATRLLPLRVADPYGGPPWGMRIVRTSRDVVCLQIGRVAHGVLGELGIDGAFGDDGRLHPRPASALPQTGGGAVPSGSQNTHCGLAGQAFSVADLLVPSSAADLAASGGDATAGGESASARSGAAPVRARGDDLLATLESLPSRDLRDIYVGVLGPQAVSVSYELGGATHTQPVTPGSGAYLIVLPLRNGQSRRDFGTATGASYGELTPSPGELLSKITYRIAGVLCERGLSWERTPAGAWRPTGTARDVAHPCPEQEGTPPRPLSRPAEMHRPVHAHLVVRGGVARGLRVTFEAPYAVSSAREGYSLFLPQKQCHPKHGDVEVEGGMSEALGHNVRRGAEVSYTLPYPFRVKRLCRRRTVIVKVVYERFAIPRARTIVGEVTVKQPLGVRNGTHRKRH